MAFRSISYNGLSWEQEQEYRRLAEERKKRIAEEVYNEYAPKFKKKYAKTLKELKARAEKHEILFVAQIWTGNCGGIPMYTTFDLDDALRKACYHGWENGHRNLTRIEYQEIGYHHDYYAKEIGYLGFPDN